MNADIKTAGIDMRAKLSTLWIFALFNVIFRDIHELFRPGFLQEIMTGTANGTQMTEATLLVAGILLEIPIAMVILSRMLPYRINRWANVIVAPLTVAFMIANGVNDLDDIWFLAIAIIALGLIVWFAWRWPKQEA